MPAHSPPTPVTEDDLRNMTQAIVRAVDPVCVILFGSRAAGTARPDSDVDLLIVEDRPFGPERTRLDEIGRIMRSLVGFFVPIDILVYSRDEIERWRGSHYHVVGRALREGRLLHGHA